MARDDRPASNTTTGPAVPGPRRARHAAPGPRRQASEQGDTGQHDTQRYQGGEAASPVHASAEHALERTRLGGTWVAIGCFAVVLVFLLVFILRNSNEVSITLFWTHIQLPLGVALVLSAACGALLVLFAGMARIIQLRSRARKHRRAVRAGATR